MNDKITRRTSLKAIAASAVAGGAWLANLAIPELWAHASSPVLPKGAKVAVKKLTGADLNSAVSTFLGSPSGKALSSHLKSLGRSVTPELASAIQWDYAGQSRIGVVIPAGSDGSQMGAFGVDLTAPESAGASRIQQLTAHLLKATTYQVSAGSAIATHEYLADRAHQRVRVTEMATGQSRTVTHADLLRTAESLQPKQTAGVLGLTGATVANADSCGLCVFLAAAFVSLGGCAASAWLACFLFVWDPPVAAACAALVGIWGGAVLYWICWALGLGLGVSYGCYVIGFCPCPYPWGC